MIYYINIIIIIKKIIIFFFYYLEFNKEYIIELFVRDYLNFFVKKVKNTQEFNYFYIKNTLYEIYIYIYNYIFHIFLDLKFLILINFYENFNKNFYVKLIIFIIDFISFYFYKLFKLIYILIYIIYDYFCSIIDNNFKFYGIKKDWNKFLVFSNYEITPLNFYKYNIYYLNNFAYLQTIIIKKYINEFLIYYLIAFFFILINIKFPKYTKIKILVEMPYLFYIMRLFLFLSFINVMSSYLHYNNIFNLHLISINILQNFNFFFDLNNLNLSKYNLWINTFIIGIDGITLIFIFLTLIIFTVIHFLIGTKNIISKKTYYFLITLIFVLEFQLILTFLVQNLLLFYIFFESTLIPMFFIIGFFGSRSRKVVAAFYLFLYTIIGSLFLLIGIMIIFSFTKTFFLPEIYLYNFPIETQIILWFLFFLGFIVKLPSIPFHLWLPEAHVEAPTIGSIILASILLKLGGYGLLRISLKIFPEACIFYQPFVFVIAIISIIYVSLTALRQTDIKKIIAYSSIAHMNFILIGLFCFNKMGLLGSFYLMFGHGLVSGGLFLLIGLLYDRYGTRSIFYYGGLIKTMPYFCALFLLFNLANLGFPGLVNFVGEFLIMLGIVEENMLLFFLISLGFILSAIYSIWLFNRLAFGNIKSNYLKKFQDLLPIELNFFINILLLSIIFFGIYTKYITIFLDYSLNYYLIDYTKNTLLSLNTEGFFLDQFLISTFLEGYNFNYIYGIDFQNDSVIFEKTIRKL